MIFALYSRVVVKLGDERHVYDSARLMYTEVAEVEKVTGLAFGEWQMALGKGSITAMAALLHILRKRQGMASDFLTMQFNAAEFDVVPIHADGTEFTAEEVAADLAGRMRKAEAVPDPTLAEAIAAAPEASLPTSASSTPASSPNGSASGPGNGGSSRTPTSSRARHTSTARQADHSPS